MRQITIIALAFTLCGCANARRMCGLEQQPEWHELYRAPRESAALVSLIPVETGLHFPYERNHRYWFSRSDGALLVCRQQPQQFSYLGRCDSDGWVFELQGGRWQTRQEWESWCTE